MYTSLVSAVDWVCPVPLRSGAKTAIPSRHELLDRSAGARIRGLALLVEVKRNPTGLPLRRLKQQGRKHQAVGKLENESFDPTLLTLDRAERDFLGWRQGIERSHAGQFPHDRQALAAVAVGPSLGTARGKLVFQVGVEIVHAPRPGQPQGLTLRRNLALLVRKQFDLGLGDRRPCAAASDIHRATPSRCVVL